MARAVLIAGNAQRFYEDLQDLYGYLTRVAGIGKKRIKEMRSAYLDASIVEVWMLQALEEKTKDPLLIAYCGHGAPDKPHIGVGGWGLDDCRFYGYDKLAAALLKGTRPVVVVNDCCHAMTAATHFEKAGVSSERVSLIAASEVDEVCHTGLIDLIIDSWRKGKPLRYGPELRWGARHDPHFFPKPKPAATE